MKLFYDLHIHSDLSPCANADMTPNNIVRMAFIKGLNVISITDHNTAYNLPAVLEVGKQFGIKVIPGIEVTSKEEIHILCYFKNVDDAVKFGVKIYNSLPDIKNKEYIFGEQNIYSFEDKIIGSLDKLLLNASSFTINEIFSLSQKFNGISVPAHINKKSNSILEVLGFIPPELNIKVIEIYNKLPFDENYIDKYKVLKNSDAHMLTEISEAQNYMEINEEENILDYLKK